MPSTRDASHSQESSRQAKRSAGSIDHACWLKRRRPDQDRLGREQVLLDAAFATLACGAVLSTLLDILPDVLAGIGRSSGPVMNSVASRCARRGASGDHDQTKPLTPHPPFKTSRADLQLRRAAGARTPLIPARERPSRWPGFGQHGWERHTRIALVLAISLGSKSMALGCASQVLVAPSLLRSS